VNIIRPAPGSTADNCISQYQCSIRLVCSILLCNLYWPTTTD